MTEIGRFRKIDTVTAVVAAAITRNRATTNHHHSATIAIVFVYFWFFFRFDAAVVTTVVTMLMSGIGWWVIVTISLSKVCTRFDEFMRVRCRFYDNRTERRCLGIDKIPPANARWDENCGGFDGRGWVGRWGKNFRLILTVIVRWNHTHTHRHTHMMRGWIRVHFCWWM